MDLPRTPRGHTILDLLDLYEQFGRRLSAAPGLEIGWGALPPADTASIAAYAQAFGVVIPADVRAFWQHGPANLYVSARSGNDLRFAADTDFVAFAQVVDLTPDLRQLGDEYDNRGAIIAGSNSMIANTGPIMRVSRPAKAAHYNRVSFYLS